MKNLSFNKDILPHLIILIFFYCLTLWFFSPLLKGKSLSQSDISHGHNITNQIIKYHDETGDVAMWNPYMFSGMPAYFFGTKFPGQDLKTTVYNAFSGFLPGPANIVFISMLSMYILLLAFGTNTYVAALGAVAYAFGSYNIISIEVGHNAKINALSVTPLIFAGIQYLWRKKFLLGSALSLLGFLYLIRSGHYQICYYVVLLLVIQFIVKGIFALKGNNLVHFSKVTLFTFLAGVVGVLCSIGNLWVIADYQSESIRGKQILQSKMNDVNKSKSGLDRDYAFAWSQGIKESFTLYIPNAYGGGSSENYEEKDMESFKYLKSIGVNPQQASGLITQSLYWGNQPFTAGAVYIGATICFAFILGMMFLPKNESVWIGLAALIFLMLSWGKNFETLNFFLFDHLPFYNKFRTVSMTLGIVNFALVLGGALGIQKILETTQPEETIKKLKISFGIFGGLTALFWIMSGVFFSFEKETNELANFTQMFNNEKIANQFYSELISDRKDLFSADALRSLIFIGLCFTALLLYVKNILNTQTVAISLLLLVTFDMVSVDRTYLSKDNFQKTRNHKKQNPSLADVNILKSNTEGRRVFSTGGLSDSQTSYFHQSMSGYHPAKMRRYQDLADFHFGSNGQQPTIGVLRMLNAGYVKQGPDKFVEIPGPLGHAWFINTIKLEDNPDSVMNALYRIDPATTAVINKSEFDIKAATFEVAPNASVQQISFTPNEVIYESNNANDGFIVFSEIYYDKGWNAYIDEKPASYQRVNYILRGMPVPAGKHTIKFEFKPTSYIVGGKLNLAFTILSLVFSFAVIGFTFYQEIKKEKE